MNRTALFFIYLICLSILPEFTIAQSHWAQQDDFPGTARSGAVSALSNGKAYYGTGTTGSVNLNDWWEYDPGPKVWTQKEPFPGVERTHALAFAIDDTIYVVTGVSGPWNTPVYHNDFYRYIPSTDTWQALPDFPGSPRSLGVCAVANGKAYIGTGRNESDQLKDWWEYNPQTDNWTKKSDLISNKRQSAIAFSVNDTIFMGGGQNLDGGTFITNDFCAYIPSSNEWKEMSFAESHLTSLNATSFVMGDTAYVFGGSTGLDLWKYHSKTNSWISGESLVVGDEDNRTSASSFSFEDHAFIVGGNFFDLGTFSDEKKVEVWKYYLDPPKPPKGPGNPDGSLYEANYNKISIFWEDNANSEEGYIVNFYDYDPFILISKDTIPANSTMYIKADVEQNTSYYFTIYAYNEHGKSSDFVYGYPKTPKYLPDPHNLVAQTFPQAAHLRWNDRSEREDGYIVEMSLNDTSHFEVLDTVPSNTTQYYAKNLMNDQIYYFRVAAFIRDTLKSLYTWQNPGAVPSDWGAWIKEATLETMYFFGRSFPTFAIDDKLYFANTGHPDSEKRFLKEYNTTTSELSDKTSFPYHLYETNVISIGHQIYFVSGGNDNGFTKSVYVYDGSTNEWSKKNDFPGKPRVAAAAFSINGKGYIVGGDTIPFTVGNVQTNDTWEYDPSTDSWAQKSDFPGGNRENLIAYSFGDTAYVGLGSRYSGEYIGDQWIYYMNYKDFYAYHPASDTWKIKASYPGSAQPDGTTGADQNNAFFGGGKSMHEVSGGFWQYDPSTNKWNTLSDVNNSNALFGFHCSNGKFTLSESIDRGVYHILKYDPDQLTDIKDLSVEIELPDSVHLTWSYADPDASGLIIQEKDAFGFKTLDTLDVHSRNYTLYDVVENSMHTYRITQYDDTKTSEGSNEVKALIQGPPRMFYMSKVSGDSVEVDFQLINRKMTIIVEVSEDLGPFQKLDTLPAYSYPSYQFPISTDIEHVSVRMISYLNSGPRFYSDTLSLALFNLPTDLSAEWINDSEIQVQWTNHSQLDDFYTVVLEDNLGTAHYEKALAKGEYTIDITPDNVGLSSVEMIDVSLKGQFAGNSDYFSEYVDTKIRVLAPGNVDYQMIAENKARVTWVDQSKIESGYRVLHIINASAYQYDTLSRLGENTTIAELDLSAYPQNITLLVESFNDMYDFVAKSEVLHVNQTITSLELIDTPCAIYPNPATNYVYLENQQGEIPFSIMDASGKHIMSGSTNNGRAVVRVHSWSKGMYFIRIADEVRKLMIK